MIDAYRDEILRALEQGATKADIARTIGVPYATLLSAIERWNRPEKPRPGDEALEALRRLVEG